MNHNVYISPLPCFLQDVRRKKYMFTQKKVYVYLGIHVQNVRCEQKRIY
jgi:Lhr-like helicase